MSTQFDSQIELVKSKTAKLVLNPIWAAGVTLLVIITGGFGSIYSPEIRSAFPFQYPANGPWSRPASGFWLLAVVSATAFFVRQWADDKERRRNQEVVLQQARELEKLVRTLPPANFLEEFAGLYDKADEMYELLSESATSAELQNCIRFLLRSIASLARQFDGASSGVSYAANIMVYKATSNLSADEKQAVAARLRFCDESTSLDKLAGALDLLVELSTGANNQNAEPDINLSPFALPIPVTPKVNERFKILPGAPVAFCEGDPDGYSDTLQLRHWCDTAGDFTEEVKSKLEAYFNNAKHIRSFVSIPLAVLNPDSNENKHIGVLNIHSSEPGLLQEKESILNFVCIICPLEAMVSKLLDRYLRTSR